MEPPLLSREVGLLGIGSGLQTPLRWLIFIFLLASPAVFGVAVVLKFLMRRSLRAQVEREIRQQYKRSPLTRLRQKVVRLYYPSAGSVVTVLTTLAAALVVVYWRGLMASPKDADVVASLVGMNGKIALAFVSLIIFASGLSSRTTTSGISVAEVLLKKTYLFPIGLFVLGLYVESYFVKDRASAWGLVVIVSFLAGSTFYQLAHTLLDESRLERGGVDLLKDRIRRSMALAVLERAGKNRMVEELKDRPLEYTPFLLGRECDQYVIRTSRNGLIYDVDLKKLSEFAETLESISNENGYAFGEKQKLNNPTVGFSSALQEAATSGLTVERRRYFMKLFMDPVGEKYDGLLCYPRVLVQDAKDRQRLEKLGASAFTVRSREPFSKRLEKQLETVKDEAISAVENQRSSRLASILEVYTELLETFMNELQAAGAQYSLDSALKEIHSIEGGWNEVKWVKRGMMDIVNRACGTGGLDCVRKVMSAIFRMGYLAISRRNLFVFLEISDFAVLLYRKSGEIGNSQTQNYVLEHSLQILKSMGNYVEIDLRRPENNLPDVEQMEDFALAVLMRFHDLFNHCIEQGRLVDFLRVEQNLNGAFYGSFQVGNNNEEGRVRARLERSPLTAEDRKFYKSELTRLQRVRGIAESVANQTKQMMFTVGGLVFKKLLSEPNNEKLSSLNDDVSSRIADNPSSLTDMLNTAYKPFSSARFGWESWDALAERPESGGAYDPYEALVEYYCYCLVRMCQALPDEAIESQSIAVTPDFVREISEHGRIVGAISAIETDRAKWGKLIPNDWLPKLQPLRSLFGRLVAEQNRAEEDKVINAPLNSALVKAFADKFVEAFLDSATVRSLFRRHRGFDDQSRRASGANGGPKWGLSMVEEKEKFINWREADIQGRAERYGQDLGGSESQFVFGKLYDPGTPLAEKAGESLADKLQRALAELSQEGFSPTVVLTNLGPVTMYELEKVGAVAPEWKISRHKDEPPGLEGYLKLGRRLVPIFFVRSAEPEGAVWVSDIKACARWIQLPAADDEGERRHFHRPFILRIIDLGHDGQIRQGILQSNPPWLAPHEDKAHYLSQRVLLQIHQRFDINVVNARACRKFIWGGGS